MNKVITVNYYDSDTTDTIRLAMNEYKLDLLDIERINENEVNVTVKGKSEYIDRFVEDNEDGCLEPMESKAELSDIEYAEWLKNELKKINIEWNYNPSDYADIQTDETI